MARIPNVTDSESDPKDVHRATDVFGIQRDVPKNYVTRAKVDDVFVESLVRDKHIVVYGSSKQGKTTLRKHNLSADQYISVTCHNRASLGQLHAAILKEAGYTIELSTTKTLSGESKITARIQGGLRLGPVHLGGQVGEETTSTDVTTTHEIALELDPADVNDIIRALSEIEFAQYIVLEDFHYLPIETQEAFSIALKAFHERSDFTFIVVGVWLDENRLIQYNGDLTGRVLSVNADAWSRDELLEVISRGEELLNITVDAEVKDSLVDSCFDSVYIVQEACYRLCVNEGVEVTQAEPKAIGSGTNVTLLVQQIVNEQSARYDNFLSGFAQGFQETVLQMHRWLLLPVLMGDATELEEGLGWNHIRKVIDANHPDSPINRGSLTQSLRSVASLQVKAKITPIILDYDQTRKRLNVVDRGFLVWLNYQDRETLRDSLGLPAVPVVPDASIPIDWPAEEDDSPTVVAAESPTGSAGSAGE